MDLDLLLKVNDYKKVKINWIDTSYRRWVILALFLHDYISLYE